MSAKLLPIILILFVLISCQPQETERVSTGQTSTPPAVDNPPVVSDVSVPSIAEDTESNFIYLPYIDPDGDQATSCQIANRQYLNVTSPCVCTVGYCFLKVQPFANYNGPVSFHFSVTANNLTSNLGRVAFSVTSVSDAPQAHNHSFSMEEDTHYVSNGTLSYPNLPASDSDGRMVPLICSKVTDPGVGIVTVNADCSFDYVPPVGYVGSDEFTFRVFDGFSYSAPATVYVTVTHHNDAPVANNMSVIAYRNRTSSITLNGTDANGDALVYTVTRNPSQGTLTGDAPNLTYTPATGFTGLDVFEYVVSDGVMTSGIGVVYITVKNRTVYLAASGNDATGMINDDTRPFLTAQAAVNAATAASPIISDPVYIEAAAGNFGDVTFSANFGANIYWKGMGAGVSVIGNLIADGADGAAGTNTGDPALGQWNGSDGVSAINLTISSDFSLTFGNVSASGGDGGLNYPDTVDYLSVPGAPGNGGVLQLKGYFGTISAKGGSGDAGGKGGTVVLVTGSTSGAIDVSGGLDLCTIAQYCATDVNAKSGGTVTIQTGAVVTGNITAKGGENNGVVAAERMLAGSGGAITVAGTVNGSIYANGGDSFDSQVGKGGSISVTVGATVSGDLYAQNGIYANDGLPNESGYIEMRGTANDIHAEAQAQGGGNATIKVNGTMNNIYAGSPNSSCTLAAAGTIYIYISADVNNIYADGGNLACSNSLAEATAARIYVYGKVNGTINASGGDNDLASDEPGRGGYVEIHRAATVNNIVVDGGSYGSACKDGGDGGYINIYGSPVYDVLNFSLAKGLGDPNPACSPPATDGAQGVIVIN